MINAIIAKWSYVFTAVHDCYIMFSCENRDQSHALQIRLLLRNYYVLELRFQYSGNKMSSRRTKDNLLAKKWNYGTNTWPFRLLQSSGPVALGLSVGYDTWPPTGWLAGVNIFGDYLSLNGLWAHVIRGNLRRVSETSDPTQSLQEAMSVVRAVQEDYETDSWP